MKSIFKLTKAKFITLILVLCITLAATAGGSIAYFTDFREETNVFTAGIVEIEMTEAAVKSDVFGNLIEDPEQDRIVGGELDNATVHDYGVIFPGQQIYKDPTIKNVGNTNAWIAAKIIITDGVGDIHNLYGYNETDSQIDIEGLLVGGLLDERVRVGDWNGIANVCYNERYAMAQVSSRADGCYEFYFFMLEKMSEGEEVTIFDTMYVDSIFDNADIQELVQLNIVIQAFAVQAFGFNSCYDAMREAFGEHFEKCE